MKVAYPIIITKSKTKYVVTVPDLDINTEGSNIVNAMEMAQDAIGLWGITKQDLGQTIPEATDLPDVPAGSIAQYVLVDFDAYRRAHDMRTIRKNVTLPSYLNEVAERAGINFSQVLQEGIKQKLGLA